MRLKDVAKLNTRSLDDSTSGDYMFKYIDISSVSFEEGIVLGENIAFRNAPSRARRIVQKGDVLISTVRTYLRAIADIDWDAKNVIASTGFAVFTPDKNINPRFLAYAVKSSKVINQICRMSKGVSYPAIQAPIISLVDIPFYPIAEQETIAAYLDKECRKFGNEINLLERKTNCYRRLKRSLINNVVTRGLNSQVRTKISEGSLSSIIPFHWEERRVKDIFTEVSIKGCSDEPMLCATQTKGVILQSMYEKRVVTALTGLENMKLVEKGNFVISLRSFQGGIELAYYRGIISAAYTILKLDEQQEKDFYRYLFKSASFIKLMKKCVTGIREGQNINYSIFKYEKIPVPSPYEQREIVAYLDDKCNKIDAIINKIESKIELLKELKRSLINEVVTGQRAINISKL